MRRAPVQLNPILAQPPHIVHTHIVVWLRHQLASTGLQHLLQNAPVACDIDLARWAQLGQRERVLLRHSRGALGEAAGARGSRTKRARARRSSAKRKV